MSKSYPQQCNGCNYRSKNTDEYCYMFKTNPGECGCNTSKKKEINSYVDSINIGGKEKLKDIMVAMVIMDNLF